MKRIALIALMTLFSFGEYAQNAWQIKAGINRSRWDGYISTRMLTGYEVGVARSFKLVWVLSLQPSLTFSAKGAKIDMIFGEKSNARQYYLELPVMLNARIPIGSSLAFNFAAGPYFAYGIAGRIHGTIPTVWYDNMQTTLVEAMPRSIFGKNGLKRFDSGLEFSVAFEIGAFGFGADYQFGFTTLSRSYDDRFFLGKSLRNISLSIWTGYKF